MQPRHSPIKASAPSLIVPVLLVQLLLSGSVEQTGRIALAQDFPDQSAVDAILDDSVPSKTKDVSRSQMTLEQIRGTSKLPAASRPSDYQPNPQALEIHKAAEALLKQGQPDAARAQMERALQLDPNSYQIHQALAELAVSQGRLADAEEYLAKALEIDADHMELHILQAQVAENRSQQGQAVRSYAMALLCSDATDDNVRTAALLLELSQLLGREGYIRAALEVYQKLLAVVSLDREEPFPTAALQQLASEPARLWVLIGALHAELDQPEQALEAYEKALRMVEEDSRILLAVARGLAELGEFERALKTAERLSENYRNRTASGMLLVWIRDKQGQLGKAVDDLKQLRSRYQDDSRIAIVLASCYQKLGQVDDARKTLVDEISFNKRFLPAYHALAGVELQEGHRAEAVKWLGQMVRANNAAIADAGWRIAKIAGDTEQARQLLSELQGQEEVQSDFALSWAVGIVTELAEMPEQAQIHYGRAVELRPDFEPLYVYLVRMHLQLSQADQALAAIRRVQKINPSATDFYRLEGLAHLLKGDLESGIVSLEAAVGVNPDDQASREALAGALMAVARPDEAAGHLETLARANPEEQSFQRQLIAAYLADGRAELAAKTIQDYMAENRLNPKTALVAAQAMLAAEKPQRALEILRQTSVDPELAPHQRRLLIEALIQSAQLEEALGNINNWLEQAGSPRHRANLAAAFAGFLLNGGHKQQASELASEELKASPENRILREALIHILLVQKDYKRSADLIADWLAKKQDRSTKRLRITLLIAQQDYREAERQIRALLSDQPEDVETLHLLASLYESSGRGAQSAEQYENIIRVSPNDIWANNNLGYYLANTNQRLEEAEKMIRLALYKAGPEASIIDSMGWVLYKRGRFGEALGYLSRSVRLINKEQAELLEHLGDTYYRLGDSAKAAELWTRGLKAEQRQEQPDSRQLDRLQNKLDLLESGKSPPVAWSVVDDRADTQEDSSSKVE